MGFGLLIYGYLMMIDFGVSTIAEYNIGFDVFPDIVGYIIFFTALKKLSRHASGFRIAKYLSIPLIVLGAVKLAAEGFSFFGKYGSVISSVLDACEWAKLTLFVIFNLFLLSGVRSLAARVELPKTVKRSTGAMIINLLYFIMKVSVYAFPFAEGERYFMILSFSLTWYLLVFFTIFVMFNCYMYICYEGDENIMIPESRLTKLLKKIKK